MLSRKVVFAHLTRCVSVLAVVAACSDLSEPIAPVETPANDPLVAELVRLGFRPDMIIDHGEQFIVEGDINILKSSLRQFVARHSPSRTSFPDTSEFALQQYRTSTIVTAANADKIVIDLSALDASAPEWASAARLAIASWNLTGQQGSWIGIEEGAPADIYVIPEDTFPTHVAGAARFPIHAAISGKPGDTIWVNPAFLGTASSRHHTVAHEIGHAVGLRHTNWYTRNELDPEGIGAVHIPGTPGLTGETGSIMNGGIAGTPWGSGFTEYDKIAIRTLYPAPDADVVGPTFIDTAGSYSWTGSAVAAPGPITFTWYRENVCITGCYMERYWVGSGPTLGPWPISSGPAFKLFLVVNGPAGQKTEEFQMVGISHILNPCGMFC